MTAAALKPAVSAAVRAHRRAFMLAALLAALFNCTPTASAMPQDAPDAAAGQASVHGTVVNSVTHQPIARALVTCANESMLTDNEGRFLFALERVNSPWLLALQARRPGYNGPGDSQVAIANVTVGSTGAEVTLTLTPAAAIVGELSLPGDDAADGLQIQLLHREIRNGRARWANFRNTQATSEGRFRFGNLPAGAYLLHVGASLDPAPARSDRVRLGYVPVFYPSARELAGAGVITVTAGQQVEAKMALAREPYYPIAIPVVGDAMRGIGFEVSSESFLGLQARFSPQDGMVHAELPNGHYRLEGRSFGPTPLAGQREFDVIGAPIHAGAITLTPTGRIPVTVRAEFSHTTPAAPEEGKVTTAAAQVNLDPQSETASPSGRGGRPSFQDDPSSSETGISYLTAATPGRYWLNAHAYNGYVASAVSGGVDLLEEPLVIGADGSAPPIALTLRDDTASLTATLGSSLLQSGALQTQVYLYLIPRTGTAEERTDAFPADDTAQLSNLAPGSYLAFATTAQQQLEYRNPKVLAALAGKAQAITLPPGGTERVTLDSLVDLATLSGRGTP